MPRKISLFVPCFVDQLQPEVAVATVKVLRRIGYEVDYPQSQTCCGQP
ncbi:MAG TPA: heterodisulfide reductase-related iron-sulfur binding cluster, partial [Candidatus Angelobacter sp.]|nr:heterodisulfide reductase-related iron-sulfur binding cluster [Candidatus Angelobacter sp.]